jgi:hypothetical protein
LWYAKQLQKHSILLFVDRLNRKACAYVLIKSKKEKRAEVSVKTIQGYNDEVGSMNFLAPLFKKIVMMIIID